MNMKPPQFFQLTLQSVQNPLLLTRPVSITSAEGRTGVSEVKEVGEPLSRFSFGTGPAPPAHYPCLTTARINVHL